MQLPCLGIDITRQDVIQHHILDKVRLIEFLVVILLDALQADGQHCRKLTGSFVCAFHKHGIFVMLCAGELLVGVAVLYKPVSGKQALLNKALTHLTDQVQLRAGDHRPHLIHHAHHTVDRIFHLVDHALKYSVSHTG